MALYVTSSGVTPAILAISARVVVVSSGVSDRVWIRMLESPSENTCGSSSSTVRSFMCARTSSTVDEVIFMGAWKSVPPLNSIPSVSPRTRSTITVRATRIPEKMNQPLRFFMKS